MSAPLVTASQRGPRTARCVPSDSHRTLGGAGAAGGGVAGGLAGRLAVNRVLPAPLAVAEAAWGLAVSGELWKHVWVSTARAGRFRRRWRPRPALGLLTGTFRPAATLLDSTLQMVRNIPPLALIPLVILWFGIDETAKLFWSRSGCFSRLPEYLPRDPLSRRGPGGDGAQLWPVGLAAVPRGDPARRTAQHPGGRAFLWG